MTVSRTLPKVTRASLMGPQRSLKQRLVRWLLKALVVGLSASMLVMVTLRFVNPPTSAFMVERQLEASRKNEKLVMKHQWVPLSRISLPMQLAVIAAEDQKFPTHFGFDVEAIQDAVEDHLEGKSSRGASTLSQQVAKNLFLWSGHSYLRKALEVYFTLLLEVCWPKRRILEVYLNVAEFGNGIYGVETAARTFFNKPASTLTLDEAAMMAAVLPNPKVRKVTAPSASVAQRTGWIIDQAQRLGYDTLKEVAARE